MIRNRRLMRDLAEIARDDTLREQFGIFLEEESRDNNYLFKCHVGGPKETPYEGGDFRVQIIVPPNYPYDPPKVTFESKVWHPNISSSSGYVCLDMLSEKWRASMTLKVALLSVFSLLESPDPASPQDLNAGRMCDSNFRMYERTAQMWTFYFANGSTCDAEYLDAIQHLAQADIGSSDSERLLALSLADWDRDEAATSIICAPAADIPRDDHHLDNL